MSEKRQQILDDIKSAMKAGDKTRLGTLRLISAAIKQKEIDERVELTDEDTITILDKMLKQRRESIAQYETAGRDDLKAIEVQEMDIIQGYMPAALDSAEVDSLVQKTIADVGANSIKDMGRVMAQLKPALQGRADMAAVSASVKKLLGNSWARSIMSNTFQFIDTPRIDPRKSEATIRIYDFREIYGQFDADEAAQQADRCLACGNPYITTFQIG